MCLVKCRPMAVLLCLVLTLILPAGCQTQKESAEGGKKAVETIRYGEFVPLDYKPAPADNPLKGFMPYRGVYNTFPYSMEWFYVPLSELMDGPESFTFEKGLDPILNEIASRGHQAVFRVYLDYPAKQESGVPKFLIDGGLKFNEYSDYGGGKSPDYNDENLIAALERFIKAFGEKYDGDPRIGFITAGLMGYWGEWHTYPHTAWMPPAETLDRILTAYDHAFNKTRILVRYPTTGSSVSMNIGFHDDSFAFQTLPTQSYHFMTLMEQMGAVEKWRTEPIGGEMRPEIQVGLWSLPPDPNAEDFKKCVAQTHASWLIAHYIFTDSSITGDRFKRAYDGACMLGYEFYISSVKLGKVSVGKPLSVEVKIRNKGVAPFYYDWPVTIGVVGKDRKLAAQWDSGWKLTDILPGTQDKTMSFTKDSHGLEKGEYKLVMGAANPIASGYPLKFADAGQDADIEGWLTLGAFQVK